MNRSGFVVVEKIEGISEHPNRIRTKTENLFQSQIEDAHSFKASGPLRFSENQLSTLVQRQTRNSEGKDYTRGYIEALEDICTSTGTSPPWTLTTVLHKMGKPYWLGEVIEP